ncbi:hypothetical protein I6F30_11285 [Bradyrhizobium sp. NBAIM20]|uniref:hypothetical protein n=1 Tax=unclassified Bradyrhizobium TaxID=2631580 RepID=UPI001CD5216A|nr:MULTISPECIES: hypothetical protein [unclassified Bradyrhizobium]MCA1411719.1 hypothetical protein [Bradyrhizobium sp. NBAIM20]MCA1460946.1 hypothetical protein [Bradyrhizobium sp. NBAIM18]
MIGTYSDLFQPVGDRASAEGWSTLCPAWLTTRCEARAEGLRPIAAAQPGDDIQVMVCSRRRRQALRRHYNRETDVFVDVGPFTPDREEH